MEIHPGVTAAYYLLLLILTAVLLTPWTALLCVCVQLIILAREKGAGAVKGPLVYSALLVLFFTLINGLLNPMGDTPLLFLNERPITAEALLRGAMAGLISAALILVFKAGACFIDNGKLLYVVGRLSPNIALMLCMTLRFIPYYSRQLKQLWETQQALGCQTNRAAGKLFWAMLSANLESAIETQLSMRYRGFGCRRGRGRRLAGRYPFRGYDAGLLLLFLGFALTIAVLIWAGIYRFEFFPRIVSSAQAPAGIAVYGAFTALPLVYRFWEEGKWRIYTKLKI